MIQRRTLITGSLATGTIATLAACSTPPVKISGKQIPVLPDTGTFAVSPNAPPVNVPPASPLAAWPQVLAGPKHAPGNVTGPATPAPAWNINIGTAGSNRQPLPANPLIANGTVFVMDADGTVSSISLQGERQWRTPTRPKHVTVTNIGGGIGWDNGTLYASTGYSELLALDAASGRIKWRQTLDYPARSAPTISNGLVALVTQNDLLLTFDAASGTPGWRFIGKIADSPTGVAASGAPAIDSNIVVAGFSSGTLAGLDLRSGTPIWEQSLASSYGQSSPLDFSDIVASPVISNGVVYAIGLGNSAIAVDLHSGAKVWSYSATGTQAFCLVGDFAYVLDISQKLTAIHAADGIVSWISQLPNFRNMKKKTGPVSWNGPIMVNGELLFTSSLGDMLSVNGTTGALNATSKISGQADMPPTAANGMLLVLTRNATLTAYR